MSECISFFKQCEGNNEIDENEIYIKHCFGSHRRMAGVVCTLADMWMAILILSIAKAHCESVSEYTHEIEFRGYTLSLCETHSSTLLSIIVYKMKYKNMSNWSGIIRRDNVTCIESSQSIHMLTIIVRFKATFVIA